MLNFRSVPFPDPILSEVLAPFPKDFVIVNSLDSPKILSLILRHPQFPEGTEVVTQELSAVPWDKACKGKAEFEIRQYLMHFAGGVAMALMLKTAERKKLRLWLGVPVVENAKCYNSYVLYRDGVPAYFHRKYYLFNKKGVFAEKNVFDASPNFDGHVEGRTVLICHEMQGLYDPVWKKCRLPEARDGKSRLVIVPAVWTAEKKGVLRGIARTVARKIKEPIDILSSFHPQGSVVLVADDNWAGVFGAVEKGRQKGASFAEIRRAGWIHLDRYRKTFDIVEA